MEKQVLAGEGERVRIFSYLPNPRLFKATIAARYSGAELEIVGAAPRDLANALWDYEPRILDDASKEENSQWARTASMGFQGALYKTDAFLAAHPYGNVPAAFAGDERLGVFESNSIMRAVARAGNQSETLYGPGWSEQSRIDGFLDRTLLFADAVQRYVLMPADKLDSEICQRTADAFIAYLKGIEAALTTSACIASDAVSLADIAFACEIALLTYEYAKREALSRIDEPTVLSRLAEFPGAAAHLQSLSVDPAFVTDLKPYFEQLADEAWWVAS